MPLQDPQPAISQRQAGPLLPELGLVHLSVCPSDDAAACHSVPYSIVEPLVVFLINESVEYFFYSIY